MNAKTQSIQITLATQYTVEHHLLSPVITIQWLRTITVFPASPAYIPKVHKRSKFQVILFSHHHKDKNNDFRAICLIAMLTKIQPHIPEAVRP